MHELNMALMQYNMPSTLRSTLIEAFKAGYSMGGDITQTRPSQHCGGDITSGLQTLAGVPIGATACVV
jgi:hypothetical protein